MQLPCTNFVHVLTDVNEQRIVVLDNARLPLDTTRCREVVPLEKGMSTLPKCIVVIDDDRPVLSLFEDVLGDANYEVTACLSEATAYDCVRAVMPDAVILDIRMETSHSGWDVLDRIKGDPLLQMIPVLVCSANSSSLEEHGAVMQKTGTISLSKPFDLDDLLRLLDQALDTSPTSSDAVSGTSTRQ